jgi:hypothetical protein
MLNCLCGGPLFRHPVERPCQTVFLLRQPVLMRIVDIVYKYSMQATSGHYFCLVQRSAAKDSGTGILYVCQVYLMPAYSAHKQTLLL